MKNKYSTLLFVLSLSVAVTAIVFILRQKVICYGNSFEEGYKEMSKFELMCDYFKGIRYAEVDEK